MSKANIGPEISRIDQSRALSSSVNSMNYGFLGDVSSLSNDTLENVNRVFSSITDFKNCTVKQINFLSDIETRLLVSSKFCPDVKISEVIDSLINESESLEKLRLLDEKGHQMNLIRNEDYSFVFVSTWNDVKQVAKDHRYLVYDAKAYEKVRLCLNCSCNGDVETIVRSLGVELADRNEQELICSKIDNIYGRAWLYTDSYIREENKALMGRCDDVIEVSVDCCLDFASFRAKVRVQK